MYSWCWPFPCHRQICPSVVKNQQVLLMKQVSASPVKSEGACQESRYCLIYCIPWSALFTLSLDENLTDAGLLLSLSVLSLSSEAGGVREGVFMILLLLVSCLSTSMPVVWRVWV